MTIATQRDPAGRLLPEGVGASLISDAERLRHDTFCNVRDGYPCSCGLDAFIAKLKRALEER